MFGQCLCGSVQFETNIHPEQITVCHCSMCRKWGGGIFDSGSDRSFESDG